MAVANSKSASISAFDSDPKRKVGSHKHAGIVLSSNDSAEVAAADDNGSVYRILRLPSYARILRLELLNDAIAGGSDYDLGVYEIADNGGLVKDADLFADLVSMVAERTLGFNAMYERGLDIADGDQRLWELLGEASDPFRDYDIALTGNVVGTAAGTLQLNCDWVK